MKHKIYSIDSFSFLLLGLLLFSITVQGQENFPSTEKTDNNLLTGGTQQTTPERIRFSFSGYGNPQRPFPGYVGPFQLGPVSISGSGVVRGKDGALLSGGRIVHTDNLRDRRYPRHSTIWQVVQGLNVQSAGGRTVLRLQVRVISSNYTNICPVGALGILELIDDNRRLGNGYNNDGIRTEMPNPLSYALDGGAACRTHTHGMNNTDVSWTDPPSGGPPGGGQWANVEIAGDNKAPAFPSKIRECETSAATICGTWTYDGRKIRAVWQNGAEATLTLEKYDGRQIVVTRYDASGSSRGMTARYVGQVQGNRVVNGKVTWTWRGKQTSGTWTASWD